MNYLKILFFFGVIFLASHTKIEAQTVSNNQKVLKIASSELPKNIQKTLKQYADYNVKAQTSVLKKSKGGGKVYRVELNRNGVDYIFLMNRKGKILAVENGEPNNKPNR